MDLGPNVPGAQHVLRSHRDLGTITDVRGDLVETMRAPAGSDIVLGVSTYPAAPTGGWLFELGSGLEQLP